MILILLTRYLFLGVDRMNKRACERVPARLALRFPSGNTFCSGNVMNLSEDGMYINSETFSPLTSIFEVCVQLKDGTIKVPVKIVRIVISGNNYEGMGVKLLTLSKEYLELLIKIKLGSQSLNS